MDFIIEPRYKTDIEMEEDDIPEEELPKKQKKEAIIPVKEDKPEYLSDMDRHERLVRETSSARTPSLFTDSSASVSSSSSTSSRRSSSSSSSSTTSLSSFD